MEQIQIQGYLKTKTLVNTKVSQANELVKEINSATKLPFFRLYQLIKRNGCQCVRECYLEARKNGKNPTALFLWLMKKNKTRFI